jgi:hypothetical protein
MTDLTRKVSRRTITTHRRRRIVVSLHPGDIIGVREERRRKEFTVPVASVYDFAVKLWAYNERLRKAAERKSRKA